VPSPEAITEAEINKAVADMRAQGQIANIPPPQLDPIIAEYKLALENLLP